MKKILHSRFFKPFILFVILVTVSLNFSPMSTEASTHTVEEAIEKANYEDGIIILEALKFNEEETAFVDFDKEYAMNKGLLEEDLANVEVFYELENESFELFKDAKLEIENQNDNGSSLRSKNPAKDIAVLATVIASLLFLGKALITQITNDLYTLGAKKFCRSKWAKQVSKIKQGCEDLDYSTN